MILDNKYDISFDEDGEIGKITERKDEKDDDGFREIKEQFIRVKSIENKDGKFSIEYEEITEEEAQRIKKNQDYVDELAEALKDKLDSKELLKDALSDLPEEERKEMLEDLEDDESDTEVKNEGGCHQLVINKGGEESHRLMVRP